MSNALAHARIPFAGVGIHGEMTFVVRDANGKIRQQWQENRLGRLIRVWFGFDLQGVTLLGHWSDKRVVKNLVTSAGKAGVASRINGAGSEAAFTYLAVGTGTNAAADGDTTLQTEITDSGLARAAATCTRETITVTNDTATLDKTFSVTGTKAVTEAGALNASSSGVLLGRQVFSAINVVSGDTLQITYKFQTT